MTDERTERVAPVPKKGGEEARAARERLARHLLQKLGASEDVLAAGVSDAAGDPRFLDDVVLGLVDDGALALARLPDRRATEEDLDPKVLGAPFQAALDRRRGVAAGVRERARLARLYAIVGDDEKAASCYREVLGTQGSAPPVALVVELALVARKAGRRALALGAVDRIAEVVLTGDMGNEGRVEDALTAGAALERARDTAVEIDAAPRAVALARAAVVIYERAGLSREASNALDGLARAQAAAGDLRNARITFERRRSLAANAGDLPRAARSLEAAGNAFLAAGDREGAAERFEQAGEAYAQAGDRRLAASSALRSGELRAARGELVLAASVFERARVHAVQSGDRLAEASARMGLARARLAEGAFGHSLKEAEAALHDREGAGDLAGIAEGHVIIAHVLHASGDSKGAAAHLRAMRSMAAPAVAAWAMELRAELALENGDVDLAHDLLSFAGSAHTATGDTASVVRTHVRRAELHLTSGERELAEQRWHVVQGSEAPEVVARLALIEAALSTEDKARRSTIDRAFELAYATDHHAARLAAAMARTRLRHSMGRIEEAAVDARATLESIRDARRSLPDARRKAFLALPRIKTAVELGQQVRLSLARMANADRRQPAPDETQGNDSSLNALDVLLGVLGADSPQPT